ncbi:MAG: LysR substrate-binding domain-containing protein [Pigmentiphaga sp.]
MAIDAPGRQDGLESVCVTARKLPPLRAARAFEAAARHCSFSLAGKELCLSAGAVSQQVKVLEAWVGAPLFERGPNSLRLTSHGSELLPTLRAAFDTLAEGAANLRNDTTGRRVRIAVYPNFAMNWLVPRLPRLREALPDVELEVLTTSEPLGALFNRADLAVRVYEHAPQYAFEFLFAAELFPVGASADDLEGAVRKDPAALLRLPLLHLTHSAEDWRLWLLAAGVRDPQPQAAMWFDSQAVMIQAVAHGMGVALARSPFDEAAVAAGRLRPLHPLRVSCKHGWYVITPRTLRRGRASAVRDWLLSHRQLGSVAASTGP